MIVLSKKNETAEYVDYAVRVVGSGDNTGLVRVYLNETREYEMIEHIWF